MLEGLEEKARSFRHFLFCRIGRKVQNGRAFQGETKVYAGFMEIMTYNFRINSGKTRKNAGYNRYTPEKLVKNSTKKCGKISKKCII